MLKTIFNLINSSPNFLNCTHYFMHSVNCIIHSVNYFVHCINSMNPKRGCTAVDRCHFLILRELLRSFGVDKFIYMLKWITRRDIRLENVAMMIRPQDLMRRRRRKWNMWNLYSLMRQVSKFF